MGASGKRKIRWDDGSPKVHKFIKIQKPAKSKKQNSVSFVDKKVLIINNSELDGPSPKNTFGFEHDMSNLHDAKAVHQVSKMT